MEVPATGDSMEMASPYQGQVDDFDFDIDLMEDHVSNMDSEMMGADEFTSTSHPNELNNDAIYDADMADEPSEGSMIDADNYADEDNDIDVQFEEEPYEEEMIETDQAEDVNIATPVIHLEPAGSIEDATSTVKGDATVTNVEPLEAAPQGSSGSVELASIQNEAQASGAEGLDTQAQLSTADADDLAKEPSETCISSETSGHYGKSEIGEEANETSHPAVSETEATQVHKEDSETSQIKHSTEDNHTHKAAHPEAQPLSEENHLVADEDTSLQHVAYIDESLHPVKILYQDCEIALFPPLEGDLADTFFIEDEALAYENIGEIFKALRHVLQKTMAGNEVLVIDIDTLGIQMTEDSFHTSQVTLQQILDLYLRLCRNDGTTDPDALYLTLSTKRAFPAEIADLNDAAIEGKKLSELHFELHTWDEYDEVEAGSDEDLGAHGAEEHEDEVFYTAEAEKEQSIAEVQTTPGLEEEQAPNSEQSQVQAEVVSDAQLEILHAQEKDRSASSVRSVEAAPESQSHLVQPENKESDHFDESRHIERDQEHDHGHGDMNEEHYDSEGRQSDSTATVAALPGASDIKVHIHHVPLDVVVDAGTDQDNEHYYGEDLENNDLGAEEYYEHEDIGSVDDSEAFQKDVTASENADVDAQEPADQTSVLDEDDTDELDAPPTDEFVSEILLQDENNHPSHDRRAPPLESGLNGASDKKEQTPEPADDLLGIAVDLTQNPPKDTEDDALDNFEGIDYNDPEEEFDAPLAADDEGADYHEFDENHFGDYDTHFDDSEAVELVGTDPSLSIPRINQSLSAKRSRDDEDDCDPVVSTVDIKRRRSS
ncbi:putative glutamic acid-rich protein [Penicillium digitatum]|uniref:Putative glutamic acid-rich protein n=2 Tax=Penicillium digitatum TaxID=36651 RepID=K9GAY1_PEND2|nr:putative glutamic acid-rich protein [Penicillium digitatum PHI26]QQK42016.1 putative glutamic acid-rich protein [Penicillium digitatum]